MIENTKNRWQNHRRREAYDGDGNRLLRLLGAGQSGL